MIARKNHLAAGYCFNIQGLEYYSFGTIEFSALKKYAKVGGFVTEIHICEKKLPVFFRAQLSGQNNFCGEIMVFEAR